jgi:peptidoglycan/LPS O-acetylase OafA/YrhL
MRDLRVEAAQPKGKLDALTGLRFVAAAMILVHHAQVFRIPIPPYSFDHGVSFFFVLSGFILAYVYPRLDGWEGIKNFYALRIARIWPAHAVALTASVILFTSAVNEKFFANLLMVQGWFPSTPWYFSYNAVSWSISVEFFFYLVFPFIVWNWTTTFWWKWLGAGALVALLCLIGRALALPTYTTGDAVTLHGLLYINPLARLLEFVSGMVAYLCFAWLQPRILALGMLKPVSTRIAATACELGALVLAAYFVMYSPITAFVVGHFQVPVMREWLVHVSSFPVFFLLVVVFAVGAGAASRILSTRVAVLLGEISYSVYLTHQVVYGAYVRNWPQTDNEADYMGFALCFLIILVLSLLMWISIELPCRTWVKNRLHRRTGSSPVLMAPVISQ